MKKILYRFISVLCIAAVLVLFLVPAWLSIAGLKTSQRRALSEKAQKWIAVYMDEDSADRSYLDKQISNAGFSVRDLGIKSHLRTAKTIINSLDDGKLTVRELLNVDRLGFSVVKIARSFDATGDLSALLTAMEIELPLEAEELSSMLSLAWIGLIGFYALIAICLLSGIAAAILNALNKTGSVGIVFCVFVCLTVLVFAAGSVGISQFADTETLLSEQVTLPLTWAPFAAAGLSLVAVIFNGCARKYFKREKKALTEAV